MEQYHAFLMRLQRSQNDAPWRVTLENAHTGEVLHFASELQLMNYLFKSFASNHSSPITLSSLNKSEDNHLEK